VNHHITDIEYNHETGQFFYLKKGNKFSGNVNEIVYQIGSKDDFYSSTSLKEILNF
jgi:hypothetical protein